MHKSIFQTSKVLHLPWATNHDSQHIFAGPWDSCLWSWVGQNPLCLQLMDLEGRLHSFTCWARAAWLKPIRSASNTNSKKMQAKRFWELRHSNSDTHAQTKPFVSAGRIGRANFNPKRRLAMWIVCALQVDEKVLSRCYEAIDGFFASLPDVYTCTLWFLGQISVCSPFLKSDSRQW